MFIILFISALLANPFKPLNKDFLEVQDKSITESLVSIKKQDNKKENKYLNVIKELKKTDGLFSFYIDKNNSKYYLSIKPNQLEKDYMIGITRQSGDAYMYDGSHMMGAFPFYFKRIGNIIQLIEKNIKFRAEEKTPAALSLNNHISNSIWASANIEAINEDSLGGQLLINLDKLLVNDINSTAQNNKKLTFDKSNSYLSSIQSFTDNSEIEFVLHFKSKNPNYIYTLPDSRSMLHRYHISIFSIVSSVDYSPRYADDRLGHFMTMYQDYTNVRKESAYTRYINRWNLQKATPYADISYPKTPIVFWLENTIPIEYRPAIIEGVESWNLAFEAIGYKDAIIAKIMPDDAEWDPADIRYSTIRWLVQPGSAYAVGPSRANPYTGEIYDADIRISADYVRHYYTDLNQFIEPLIPQNFDDFIIRENNDTLNKNYSKCNYQQFMLENAGFIWNKENLSIKNIYSNKIERFIYDALVDLILHEVGHTLGLRHNFKASSIYSFSEISNPNFTAKNGVTGSVMDYNAANLMDNGMSYFQTKPGPYDYWAIEYAYSETPYNMTEEDYLNSIANKSVEKELAYGTDEDTYGQSTRGIDPYSSSRDLSSEPIIYYKNHLQLVQEFWGNVLIKFENDGERYPRIRQIFSQGLWEYYGAIRNVSKFIGGVEHSRHHVGQSSLNPLRVIDGSKQIEALDFLYNYVLSKDAFSFSPELLNKLSPERFRDMRGSIWKMDRLDYPIHYRIKQIQSLALYRIFSNRIIDRVQDNEIKFTAEQTHFTLKDLFHLTMNSVWSEIDNRVNINSFRRNIQSEHVNILIAIMLNKSKKFPPDAISLSRNNLNILYKKIQNILNEDYLDEYSFSHYTDIGNRIYSAYKGKFLIN